MLSKSDTPEAPSLQRRLGPLSGPPHPFAVSFEIALDSNKAATLQGKAQMINGRKKTLIRRAVLLLLILALVGSIAMCVVLYQQAARSYADAQSVRLNPDDAGRFANADRDLPPLQVGQKRVVLFGDSRIEMWSPGPNLPGVQVINRGVSGETTAQLLLRLDRDVLALHPDVVVIEMGVNDLKNIGVFPGREQEIINSCEGNTDLMLKHLRQANVAVVLLSIFPVGDVPLTRRAIWSDNTIGQINAANRKWKAMQLPGVTVVDCDPVLSSGGRMNPAYANSTLHVNETGYQNLNTLIEPAVKKALESAAR